MAGTEHVKSLSQLELLLTNDFVLDEEEGEQGSDNVVEGASLSDHIEAYQKSHRDYRVLLSFVRYFWWIELTPTMVVQYGIIH